MEEEHSVGIWESPSPENAGILLPMSPFLYPPAFLSVSVPHPDIQISAT